MKKRLLSFKYAFQGIWVLFKEEPNVRIHAVAAMIAIGLAVYFDVHVIEWLAIAGCIGLVFFAEAMNSAIEALADHVTPEKHPQIKKVKDLAAAGVLFVAIAAGVVGFVIFGRYLF